MKNTEWSAIKSDRLKTTRGVSFEEIIASELVYIGEHPSRKNQGVMCFRYKRYIWLVPYVEDKYKIFLKTLYPSRKYTKLYKEGKLK